MVGWIILGIIVLLIFGINMIRIGADIAFENGVFRLSAKVAGILIQLMPKEEKENKKTGKEKKPKKRKEKKPKESTGEEQKEKKKKRGLPLGMNKDELFDAVKKILQLFVRFPRKFLIERFRFRIVCAGNDPYNTAMTYGYINDALSVLLPMARRSFRVRKSEVSTDLDFLRDKTEVDFAMTLTIRIGQIVGFVLSVAFAGAGVVIRSKLRQRKEKKQAKKQGAFPQNEADESTAKDISTEIIKENDKDITQPEERTESNG